MRVNLVAGLMGLAVLVTPMAASGQTPPDTGIPQTGNLVPNGGFDVGDRAGHPTGWTVEGGEALAALAGQSIKLRFSLVNTDLYSYWVS